MSRRGAGLAALIGFVVLFVLHQDLWWWDSAQRLAGLPIGLAYHVAYCGLVSILLLLVVGPLTRDDASRSASEDPHVP
ncbi:MAG: hypothetical protein K8J08_11240 [Thermoanaerobaculia bacterium]|nr:hypothetical protein [Thermoanaerobaculia bacterium]